MRNILSYKEFALNEGKNEYQAFINDQPFGEVGSLQTAKSNFDKALKVSQDGDKIEFAKVRDNKGNVIKEIKKSEIVTKGKNIRETGVADIIDTIETHLLELYNKVTPNNTYLVGLDKPLSKLVDGDIDVEQPFKVKFAVSPRDFKYLVPFSEDDLGTTDFNKEIDLGISVKKPYKLVVLDIENEDGLKLTSENIEDILLKAKDGNLTPEEKNYMDLLKRANMLIAANEADKPNDLFETIVTLQLVPNEDFGKDAEYERGGDDDDDDFEDEDDYYKSDDDDDDVELDDDDFEFLKR